jgi:predicted ester cyclase/predicted enzyme related to lactoylglutathione lyase
MVENLSAHDTELANRDLARRWFQELWIDHRPDVIDELVAPDGVAYLEGGAVCDPAAFRKVHAEFLRALPDLRLTVEDQLADGDKVVIRWHATGTHTGDAFEIKATGRPVAFKGTTWMRFRDGKLVEGWDTWNQGALFQQLRGATAPRGARLTAVAPQFVVPDVVRAAEFYRDVLGFRVLGYFLDLPVFGMVARDGIQIHFGRSPDGEARPTARPAGVDAYMFIDDADALAAELRGRGADVIDGPVDRAYGRREIVVRDCYGFRLAFGA